ncbi:MAG: shikimate dehydrogenase [Thermoflexales bacterium]|nr:shikimate dehydrogenase [Thermoflexales bacterium]MCS7324669.1 shikimate dehydrogenase [Thermoflexales bacterium]MCX7939878.1 shikimate dehydrogenase [Thermoflexales bacterium]MDW8053180.1 shikimate dehydrogenase [Anaerolineae bacterium]MDW8291831.1 shikimate dehydrogenase [Anaerolineae bacterium]
MLVFLIGYPVAHSLSAVMHNAAFRALGLEGWHYTLLETPPEQLAAHLARLRDDEVAGANVTIPHKQAVLSHLDALEAGARAIGAVNTIFKRDGALVGENTDWQGFLADLAHHGVVVGTETRALVLGAGGSARAIVHALLQCGAQVRVWNRTPLRALALVADFAHPNLSQAPRIDSEQAQWATLVVNCTAVGMWPHDAQTPWREDVPFPSHAVLYDLVYRPSVTRLMRQAQAAGARAIGGLGMLAEQGAAAFALWTGVEKERVVPILRQALQAQLAQSLG